jgi:tRNA (cmo5U34)-methyltransferase
MNSNDSVESRRSLVHDFDFGAQTADVFDDMLKRSVPFYAEIQRMTGEIAADFAVSGSSVYDLGCSTGTTLLALDRTLPEDIRFVGLDASEAMLQHARRKLSERGVIRPYELQYLDLEHGVSIQGASVVIMILTLQFIRPLRRPPIIADIALGLNEGGCLILVEKVLSHDSTLNRLFINYHHEFKRRHGYSDMEIAEKREALENVLIPYHYEENRELLLRNGFRGCDSFFRWYNFCGILAVK